MAGFNSGDFESTMKEEGAAELFHEEFDKIWEKSLIEENGVTDNARDKIAEWVLEKISKAYSEGYSIALEEIKMAEELRRDEELAKDFWKHKD
jgi:hypothetical protein